MAFDVLKITNPNSNGQQAIDRITELVTDEQGQFSDGRPGRGHVGLREDDNGTVHGFASFDGRGQAKAVLDKIKAERGKSPLSQIEVKYHRCTHDEDSPQPCVELDDVPEEGIE